MKTVRVLTLLLLFGFACPWAQGNELQDSLANLAVDLATILRGMQQDSVVLSQFTGPPTTASNADAGIHEILTRELEKNEIRVSRRAEFGIKGSYALVKDLEDRHVAKIEAEIINGVGEVQGGLDRAIKVDVSGTDAIALLFGGTASLSPSEPELLREKTLFTSIQAPTVQVKEERVQATPASLYAVEVWVYPDEVEPGRNPATYAYKPRKVTNDDGLAVVDLQKGENYAVKLINRSKLDAAVTLTIDGMDSLGLAKAKPDFWVIPAGKSGMIYGWYKSVTSIETFRVTGYAKSVAKEMNIKPGKTGVITAAFRAAWPKDQAPPADELAAQFTARGQGDEATGRGPEMTQNFSVIERKAGVIRDVVSIRYDR